ncbi:MAG: hypothetical protein ACLTYN_06705 [Dysosmobacter welbionis]
MRWVDAGLAPRAVLVLSHGVSEHILRYEPLAAYLTSGALPWQATTTGARSLRGGGAPRLYSDPGQLGLGGAGPLCPAELAGQRFPGLPVFLLGIPWGPSWPGRI